jgi:hypothetical protein
MVEYEHETIMGSKVYFGRGITENEKKTLREMIQKNPRIYSHDTHFWISDGKIRFQQLFDKEYFGNIYEVDIVKKKLKEVV